MIVAPRTGNGEAEKSAGGRIDLLIHQIGKKLSIFDLANEFLTHGEETRGDEILRPLFVRRDWQQITCDLLADEAIEVLVRIQAVDDIVSIPPSMEMDAIGVATGGFGKARHIEPVLAQCSPKRGDLSSESTSAAMAL